MCNPTQTRRAFCRLWLAALAVLLGACGGNAKPSLQPIADQTIEVGSELTIEVVASDNDGDSLTFSISCDSIPDLTTRTHPPAFVPFGPTSAYLHWTPLALDVGSHQMTIRVTDGKDSASQTFVVEVSAGSAVPVFREPLGSGTTLDLSTDACIELDILVEDPDSPNVDISLEEPITEGYQFVQEGATGGVFNWCPTSKQIDAAERYTLNLKADDRDGHIGRKKYVVVLRQDMSNCPGIAPTINHTPPGQQSTLLDIELTATVTDDLGVPGQPVLYYTLEQPADPANPDFKNYVQLLMNRTSGDALNGTYTAVVPNPVLSDTPGTVRTIYYFIEATDNDEEQGECNHRTTLPVGDVFSVDVERPSGGTTLGYCDSCSADVQCTSGMCVALAGGNGSCLDECVTPGGSCGSGGTCSSQPWTTVDGLSGLVCLPAGSSCAGACTDDAMEDNDFLTDPGVQTLTPGTYTGLQQCGNGVDWSDEDFYALQLTSSEEIAVYLDFSHSDGDIDLWLADANEDPVAVSDSLTDNEYVTACLDPGTYYIIAYSQDPFINASYDLEITSTSGGCCTADVWEPSNGALEAIPVVSSDIVDDMSICVGDIDWYQIDLQAGETITVDLLFDQYTPEQDLDLYLVDRDGMTDLTPCCDPQNGQSGSPDEQLTYTVTAAGTYYVVVEPYELDGVNSYYLIGFDVQ